MWMSGSRDLLTETSSRRLSTSTSHTSTTSSTSSRTPLDASRKTLFVPSKVKAVLPSSFLPSHPFTIPRQPVEVASLSMLSTAAVSHTRQEVDPDETQLNDEYDNASHTEDEDREADYDDEDRVIPESQAEDAVEGAVLPFQ